MGRNFNPLKGLWFPTLLIIFFLYGEPYDFSNEQTPSTFIDSEKENGTSTSAESQLLETVETTKSDRPSQRTQITTVQQAIVREIMPIAIGMVISFIFAKAFVYYLSRKSPIDTEPSEPIKIPQIPYIPQRERIEDTIWDLSESTLLLYKFRRARGIKGHKNLIQLVKDLTETEVKPKVPEGAKENTERSIVPYSSVSEYFATLKKMASQDVTKEVAIRHMKKIVQFVAREMIEVLEAAKDSIAKECADIAQDLKQLQPGEPFSFDYSKYTQVMSGFKLGSVIKYELYENVKLVYFDMLPRLILVNNLIGSQMTLKMHEHSLKQLLPVMEAFTSNKPEDEKK